MKRRQNRIGIQERMGRGGGRWWRNQRKGVEAASLSYSGFTQPRYWRTVSGCPVETNACFSRVDGYERGCVTFMTLFSLGEIASIPEMSRNTCWPSWGPAILSIRGAVSHCFYPFPNPHRDCSLEVPRLSPCWRLCCWPSKPLMTGGGSTGVMDDTVLGQGPVSSPITASLELEHICHQEVTALYVTIEFRTAVQ